jgi:hypothetical protein
MERVVRRVVCKGNGTGVGVKKCGSLFGESGWPWGDWLERRGGMKVVCCVHAAPVGVR